MGTASRNFSYSEFEVTNQEGLRERNRIPTVEVRDNVKALVDAVLQPLRDVIGTPLIVSSGYRCPEVNAAVGGAANSQHLTGSAADVYSDVVTPYRLARAAADSPLPFDQMILYNSFVHLSHSNGGRQRGQILYDRNYNGRRL